MIIILLVFLLVVQSLLQYSNGFSVPTRNWIVNLNGDYYCCCCRKVTKATTTTTTTIAQQLRTITTTTTTIASSRILKVSTQLSMGLYDKPLPPRIPFPSRDDDDNNTNKNDNDDDINDEYYVSERLFDFNLNGIEINNLLPSLGRKLSKGFIECYYEPSDRIVQTLVKQTNVNIIDACWALEACKGDITEAWTRISVARRLNLNTNRNNANIATDTDSSTTTIQQLLYETELEEEFIERKEQRKNNEIQQKLDLYNQPLKPNDPWLPGKQNPKPINDEPWFTG